MNGLPLIDVAGLNSSSFQERAAVAAKVGEACREIGFFYVMNHGVSEELRGRTFEAARQVFQLSHDAKSRMAIERSPVARGYSGIGAEHLNSETAVDQKEAFDVGLDFGADDPEVLAGVPLRGPNFWPGIPGWKSTVTEYYDACVSLMNDLHRAFAIDLDVDESFFKEKLHRSASILRFLRYPPVSAPNQDDGVGAGEHTDFGTLTILATDGVPGLQVRGLDGVWLDAPHIEGGLLCNIGDCLMRWTNDVYVSTPHRVFRPRSERYSIAFFGHGNPSAVMSAVPSCLTRGEAPRYDSITCGEYFLGRLQGAFSHLRG